MLLILLVVADNRFFYLDGPYEIISGFKRIDIQPLNVTGLP